MSELYWMVTVTERKRLPDFISLYTAHKISVSYVTLGYGTAEKEILNILGIGSSEKAVCFSLVTGETWRSVKKDLQRKLRIDVPGTGIAFVVPLSSIGGRRELAYLTDGQNFIKGEESVLKNTERELIIAICEQGYSETVMDAARSCGAGGGTIIHAKGTGLQSAEKFLGVTLASEKDVVLIVTKTSGRTAIMNAVMRAAGVDTDAKTVCFSLPVTDTTGFRLIDFEEADENAAPAER